ncbi:uncharacterized protein [Pyxicephalus adspersus]|uniref:uncharacterized protein n=1 Tax=Pyxicephalus adspersus TaxID=30357 RepID=UPI003B5B9764
MELRVATGLFLILLCKEIASQLPLVTTNTVQSSTIASSSYQSASTMAGSASTASTASTASSNTTVNTTTAIGSISTTSNTTASAPSATNLISANINTTANSASTSSNNASTSSTTISSTTSTSLTTITPNTVCNIVNNSIVNGSFQLTVTPDVLSSNNVYTVKINGSGNATVVLQAMSGANFVGNWSSSNPNCAGSPLFDMNTMLTANWTSPTSLNPVEIRAFIKVSNDTYKLTKTLNPAPTTAKPALTTAKNAGSKSRVISTYMDLSMALLFLLITTKVLL